MDDQVNYNYNIIIPSGFNLNDHWMAVMRGAGANTETQGFDALAIYLAPFMSTYDAITPGDQGL